MKESIEAKESETSSDSNKTAEKDQQAVDDMLALNYLDTEFDYKEHKKKIEDVNRKAIERIYKTIDKQRKQIKAEDENVIAHKEMCKRERFDYLQSKLNDKLFRSPICVVPDQSIKALDMLPRVDLCEDIHFRKRLPKSYKKICKLERLNED